MRLTFAEITALRPVAAGRFDAEVNPEWTILGKPNGGYLLALLGRAAAAVSERPHVVAASAHYLSSPDPGPVSIEAHTLRTGRTASVVRARMEAGGKGCVEALITTGELGADEKPYWSEGSPAPGKAAFEDCQPLQPRLPNGARIAIMEQVSVRLDPETSDFGRGRPTGRGEVRGWLSLPGDEAFDSTSLLYAVDSFPPATLDIAPTGWVPTLELTAYVRALAEPGPVRVTQRAQLIDAQRVDQLCYVWDRTGRLVAHGSQLAGVRLG